MARNLDDIPLPTIGTIFASGGKWDSDEALLWLPVIHGAAVDLSSI